MQDYINFCDLRPGMHIYTFGLPCCSDACAHTIHEDAMGGLYIRCNEGHHALEEEGIEGWFLLTFEGRKEIRAVDKHLYRRRY